MLWNSHYSVKEGTHAFLGASQYHWLNYDKDKLVQSYNSYMAKEIGTKKHELAKQLIDLKVKLPRTRQTLNMYVNDAIGFKNEFLRIHDLKTGVIPAHMEQLKIYAALFCLEYRFKPGEIQMELRIYQNDDVAICNPQADDILPIMDKIIEFDKVLRSIKEG